MSPRAPPRRGVILWLKKAVLRLFSAILLTIVSPVLAIVIFFAPTLFLVYGEQRHLELFFPRWWPLWLPPGFFVTSYLSGDGRWGVAVGSRWTRDELQQDPRRAARAARFIGRIAQCAKGAALAGQLPNFVLRGEEKLRGKRSIPRPFVPGDLGTLFAMRMAARAGASYLKRAPQNLTIAIPGGAGRIGGRLVELLGQEFHQVIALDPRYEETQVQGNINRTSNNADVARADLILALTPKGRDLEGLLDFVVQGQLLLDDTHPDIPPTLRRGFQEKGVELVKPSVTRKGFRWLPMPLPGWRSNAIPGCLLEAFVVASHGREVIESFEAFSRVAEENGFKPVLFSHPDV
jgi:hypothetical protein